MKSPEQIADEHYDRYVEQATSGGYPKWRTTIRDAIKADRAQRAAVGAEIYIVQTDTGEVVGVFRDADEATAAYQDGYSFSEETIWEPGEYAEQRIQHLTSKWEETVNYGLDENEGHRASDYVLSEDDWKDGLSDEEAAEIVRLIEWKEARA